MPATISGLFVGLMSGTSLDGIDAALIRCTDQRITFIDARACPMPDTLKDELLALCHARSVEFDQLASAEHAFCVLQSELVNQLLKGNGYTTDDIVAIGSHGQTIEHQPELSTPYTFQLDNPSLLSELTGCDVVGDFRRRDLAAGGQAAPLAPAFHQAIFQDTQCWRVALNLGGFANITLLPPTESGISITGFDTGPANVLSDYWFHQYNEGNYDASGYWARSGTPHQVLLESMLADPFFARTAPKSTGREYFNPDWLGNHLAAHPATPEDVQATLIELTARTIADAVRDALPDTACGDVDVIPCGGGAHNGYLLERLACHLAPVRLRDCTDFGWSADWMEAGAFAWLAWRRVNCLPGNLPEVTGARGPRVLGGLYRR
ncbi:anhydro-N-acetylmuramic acid kinase [Larsenimonas rhizosphaerae]|uniref:anhydro-N-acetylmuramic acid kinase n=1 Tax=Larsenimonas rhizosphaerae TaxID=2944682 RepID=UPI002033EFBE|nr:anhydro-N-acetylmuramic acid kinase [Larsenimonas rhizosphaerae]MCM2131590.1 anhydro-N-acetylmuramic acid kinase [Larsenimonas rhizosphaerae]